MVDARLPDGSRVNAVVPPIALDGAALTIRKFSAEPYTVTDLISFGTLTPPVATLLSACIQGRLDILINCAGLRAPTVAKKMEGYRAELAPRELYAKGNYYSLARRSPFSRLVYPIPEPGGLGVHVTLDLAGQARFGPDVEWVERIGGKEDYAVDPSRAERFYAAIRRYWPGLADGALLPGYSGIRPKTAGPGEPAPDFQIQGPREHGVPGLVHLFGIESPGLTASLALAKAALAELEAR